MYISSGRLSISFYITAINPNTPEDAGRREKFGYTILQSTNANILQSDPIW